jgi:hypothetical protein
MRPDRPPRCLLAKSRCGTRWEILRKWACSTTGKGVKLVTLEDDEQGKAPFYAQPVGFDGRAFFIAGDGLCDTEKLLHEVCHWLVAPKERRNRINYGLGPHAPDVELIVADNEEVVANLLERHCAPHFSLNLSCLQRPDYNVAIRRHLDWETCEARALEIYEGIAGALPAI